MSAKSGIEWSEVTDSVIERVHHVAQPVTPPVDIGSLDLHAGSNASICWEASDKTRLLALYDEVRKKRGTEHRSAFPKELHSPLLFQTRIAPEVRLVVKLDPASVQHFSKPAYDREMRHRHTHDRVNGSVSLRTDSGHEDRPLSVDDSGNIGQHICWKQRDRVGRSGLQLLRPANAIPLSVVALLGG